MEREAYQPAIDVYLLLRRTHDAVARRVEAELNKQGITTIQYGVIRHLCDGQSLSLTELSERLFRSASNMTTLIDRMERDGLVRRLDHAEDRRVTQVQLTTKGAELCASVRPVHRKFLTDLMACFEDEELAQLTTLLQKLKTRVESFANPNNSS